MNFRRLAVFFLTLASVSLVVSAAAYQGGGFEDELISIDELRPILGKASTPLVLDARGAETFRQGHIKGAKLPLSEYYYRQEELFRSGLVKEMPDSEKELTRGMQRYSKDTPIVTYCNDNCGASTVLMQRLKKLGFSHIKVLTPGYQSWVQKGYPVTAASTYPTGHDVTLVVDKNLSMRVLADLEKDPELASRVMRISVKTKDGAVTLEGVVNNAEEKALIETKVKRMDGVKSVRNKLRVKRSNKELL